MLCEAMDEFGLIAKYLAPLSKHHKGALNLTDDAALFTCRKGYELVVTKDAIAEGIHFFAKTPAKLIAKKLLRTNLSDIAAMGAKPKYYLIAAMLNSEVNESWIKEFSRALAEEQKIFGIHLIGGDTIKTNGPLGFSLTMIGEVKQGQALTRGGAKPGDAIYVSGTIGDSALGLKILQGKIKTSPSAKKYLSGRYHIPEPRLELGQYLSGIASSAIDISDGLTSDLGHICEVSGVSAMIESEAIPLSQPAYQTLIKNPKSAELIFSGGDDYELIFTVPPVREKRLAALMDKLGIRISKIGNITKKAAGKITIYENGGQIALENPGYKHFS